MILIIKDFELSKLERSLGAVFQLDGFFNKALTALEAKISRGASNSRIIEFENAKNILTAYSNVVKRYLETTLFANEEFDNIVRLYTNREEAAQLLDAVNNAHNDVITALKESVPNANGESSALVDVVSNALIDFSPTVPPILVQPPQMTSDLVSHDHVEEKEICAVCLDDRFKSEHNLLEIYE